MSRTRPSNKKITAAPPVSVLILTRNEETTLPAALASVSFSDDVVVLDSGSIDHTESIALTAGARFIHHPFCDFAAQRTFGLQNIPWAHPWVLMLDADETVSPALTAEIRATLKTNPSPVAFRMRRKDYWNAQWLRRSSGYPTYFTRLVRPDRVRVTRPVHEEVEALGPIGTLEAHLHHTPFAKGLWPWLQKHRTYANLEGPLAARARAEPVRARDLVSRDPQQRRHAQKHLAYHLPARPALLFFTLLTMRRGLLDGPRGIAACTLRAWYEMWVDAEAKKADRS